jgi:hypothetical protein
MDSDLYAELLIRAGWMLGKALVAIEANGVGTAVIKYARRAKYPALFMRRPKSTKRKDKKIVPEYGWYSMNDNKNEAYGELERCLRNGWTEIMDLDTLAEMGNVLNLGSSKLGARDPKKDDRPDGLAIAHGVIEYARAYQSAMLYDNVDVVVPDFGTMEWMERMLDEQREANVPRLGQHNKKILTA